MQKTKGLKGKGKNRNNILINTALLIATLLICFFIFELFLRIFLPQDLNYAEFDTELGVGYKLRSNFHAIYKSQEYTFSFNTNSRGLREDFEYNHQKPQGIRRIVVLGDSIGFGYTVNLEKSYSKQLENILKENGFNNIEVINAGVPGYSTYKEMMYLKGELYKYDPDIVIISLTVANDIWANIDDEQNTNELIETLKVRKPFVRYLNLRVRKFASSNLHSFQLIRKVFVSNPKVMDFFVKIGFLSKNAEFDPRETEYKLFINSILKDDPGMKSTIEILKEIKRFANEKNISLIIIPIPKREQVNEIYFKNYWEVYSNEEIDAEKPQKILSDFAESEDIGYIEPLYIMREKDLNNSFYWEADAHPNALGHEILAELTYWELLNNYKDKII